MDSTQHSTFVSSWHRSPNIPSTKSRNSCPGTSSGHSGRSLPKLLSNSPNRCPPKLGGHLPRINRPSQEGIFKRLRLISSLCDLKFFKPELQLFELPGELLALPAEDHAAVLLDDQLQTFDLFGV